MNMMLDKVKRLIWVIDDHRDSVDLYLEVFAPNVEIEVFSNLAKFYERKSGDYKIPDLLIVDLSVEDGRFLDYLRNNAREKRIACPIVIISSIDNYQTMRDAFDLGVADYLLKPISTNEIRVKIDNILGGKTLGKILDIRQQTFSLDGKQIPDLTIKQQQILSLFLQSPERMINRGDILKNIWNDTSVNPKTVDVHLYNLRRKISDHGFLIRSEGSGNWVLMAQKMRS